MSVRQRKRKDDTAHDCVTCGRHFKGSFCSSCGEKVFHLKDLSLTHLTEQTIDLFTHFDLKIPKSLGLLFKPGFLTAQWLKGIRVPYAKPVQLFIIVNLLFFVAVKKLKFTDFTPHFGDHTYFLLADHFLGSALWKPVDQAVIDFIDQQGANKAFAMGSITAPDVNQIYSERYMELEFTKSFFSHSRVFSKTLIFALVPLTALLFFGLLFRYFKYFGSAFIFAVHFVSYYLLIFSIWSLIGHDTNVKSGIEAIINPLYQSPAGWLFRSLFFGRFEFIHLCLLAPWLYLAFGRVFQLRWWAKLFLAILMAKLFYYLVFGVYKKLLILFTVWYM